MNIREQIAILTAEDRYKDSFYGEYITEHDRAHHRKLADQILSLIIAELKVIGDEEINNVVRNKLPFDSTRQQDVEVGSKAQYDSIIKQLKSEVKGE